MTGTAHDAYEKVATEFGVTIAIVRDLCGSARGTMDYHERLGLLREKMGQFMAPVNQDQSERVIEAEELRELRSCLLCEELLGDHDEGKEVVHDETGETAVLCETCATRI